MAYTSSELAALILRDAEQLRSKAQDAGVTAYLQQAVQRERPNTRFLQTTIRGVEHANRRAQEAEMWSLHNHRQQRESGAASSGDDQRMAAINARTPAHPGHGQPWDLGVPRRTPDDGAGPRLIRPGATIRGRGGIGSRMDEAGPSLPLEPGVERVNEDVGVVERRVRGCSAPTWLLPAENGGGLGEPGPVPAALGRRLGRRESGSGDEEGAGSAKRRKREGKAKKTKSRKDEKRGKDKRRKKEKKKKSGGD